MNNLDRNFTPKRVIIELMPENDNRIYMIMILDYEIYIKKFEKTYVKNKLVHIDKSLLKKHSIELSVGDFDKNNNGQLMVMDIINGASAHHGKQVVVMQLVGHYRRIGEKKEVTK